MKLLATYILVILTESFTTCQFLKKRVIFCNEKFTENTNRSYTNYTGCLIQRSYKTKIFGGQLLTQTLANKLIGSLKNLDRNFKFCVLFSDIIVLIIVHKYTNKHCTAEVIKTVEEEKIVDYVLLSFTVGQFF